MNWLVYIVQYFFFFLAFLKSKVISIPSINLWVLYYVERNAISALPDNCRGLRKTQEIDTEDFYARVHGSAAEEIKKRVKPNEKLKVSQKGENKILVFSVVEDVHSIYI